MAGTLGDLTIDLNANIAKFLTAMDEAEKKSKKTTEAIKATLLGIGAGMVPVLKEMYLLGDQAVKVTDEQTWAADSYEKGLKKLAATQQFMAKSVVMASIPVMNDFVQTLVESAKQTDSMRNSVKGWSEDGTIKEWAQKAAISVAYVIDVFDAVTREVTIAGKAIGATLAAIGLASEKDFTGAKKVLGDFSNDAAKIWNKDLFSTQLKARFEQSSYSQFFSRSTRDAKDATSKDLGDYSNKNPKKEADPGKGFIEQLQRQLQQQEKGRFEMLRLEAAQKNVSAAAAPYIAQLEEIESRQERIKDTVAQVAESEKQRAKSLSLVTAGNDQAAGIIRETAMLGMQADARRKMIELRKVSACPGTHGNPCGFTEV